MTPQELMAQGYYHIPPESLVAEGDAEIVAAWACPECNGPQKYEGWQRRVPPSYVALAVCQSCGKVTEF